MSQNEKAVVEIKDGKIGGTYRDSLYIFKGIPYAAPPVGKQRWLPPQLVKPWAGVRQAQVFGKAAPQNTMGPGPIKEFDMKDPQSEDCLYLNVWSPGLDDTRRPVLIWIHGGGFNLGSGSQPLCAGSILARRGDVVIVTINYRLGALGFLRLNEVTEGRIPSTGNEGLMDQIAALEWVRDNIAAFGGSPDNITVFGESAGGMSIGCLMAMPKARGLFHKAILQSGAGSTAVPLDSAVSIARQFLDSLGRGTGDIKALRALTVKQLLSADLGLKVKLARPWEKERISITLPVIDGETLPVRPIEAIRRGSSPHVAVLVGSNLEECKLFYMPEPGSPKLGEAGLIEHCRYLMPLESLQGLLEAYRNAQAKRGVTSPFELFTAIQTELMFHIPAIRLIEAQRHYQRAYNYLFTWKSPILGGTLGACHALDVGFVFGTYGDSFGGSGPVTDRLSRNIQDAWLAFARNGDPSCKNLGTWTPYDERRATMILGEKCYLEEAPYEEERRVWDSIPDEFIGQI